MTGSVSFNLRACYTIEPDRIYRVELHRGSLYFLRIGGQFDVDRGLGQPAGPGTLPALAILATGEALFRKHKREEMIARDPNADPDELLGIHPHNYRLAPAEITRAELLPKRWFVGLFRKHFGRLVIESGGKSQEHHFETETDLRTALAHLPALLGDKLDVRIPTTKR